MYALDITPIFNELLSKSSSNPVKKHVFDATKTDGFLKEAYRINEHIATLSKQLDDVRQAYLSTAPARRSHHHHHSRQKPDERNLTHLTDAQREDIDANAKRLLRDLNASIKGLADAEALHQETQQALIRKKYGGPSLRLPGFLGSGAAGSANAKSISLLPKSAEQAAAESAQAQIAAHHESVLWFLRQRLQSCGRAQQTMMEARLARMMVETTTASAAASQQAFLTATQPAGLGRKVSSASSRGASASTVALEQEAEVQQLHQHPRIGGDNAGGRGRASSSASGPSTEELSPEQIQIFERGNQDMIKHYESTLDKVRHAEQSLIEIAELQTMLVSNLEIQSMHVDQMVEDSANTAENVTKGNRELKKALERPSTARYTFYAASGLCLFIVVWDFFV